MEERSIIIVTGHFGAGKTNLSLNLACNMRREGKKLALCDLDIVNPYFRSADFEKYMNELGIEPINPMFAGSNVDIPALTPRLNGALRDESLSIIIDVGGDDSGAFALGRYAAILEQTGYKMIYAVNAYRYLTSTPEDAVKLLYEIEGASHLKAASIVNTSNLSTDTTAEALKNSVPFAKKVAELTDLPLEFTCVPEWIGDIPDFPGKTLPVKRFVKLPWEA